MIKYEIVQLIQMAYKGDISLEAFLDSYYDCFDLHYDEIIASKKDLEVLSELSDIANRYSPYEDEVEMYPNVYSDINELNNAIKKAYQYFIMQKRI